MRRATAMLAAGLTAALIGATGCGSPSDEPAPAPDVDLSKLDVGNYNTTPREIQKSVFDRARFSEGQRLSSVVPLPMDIDPRFTIQHGVANPYQVLAFINVEKGLGKSATGFDSNGNGFIAGFRSSAYSDSDIGIGLTLAVSVLLFQDEQSAAAAATTLADLRLSQTDAAERVRIDKFPAALVQWKPGSPEIEGFLASGRYVIYTHNKDYAKESLRDEGILAVPPDLPAMTSLVIKSLETVQPRLSAFQPTPYDQLADLALDHDGMLGRSLQKPDDEKKRDAAGLYDRVGGLHLSIDPAKDRTLFDETGVDWVANHAGLVYRAKDAASAQRITADRAVVPRLYRRADSPQNLPGAKCREFRGSDMFIPRFHCTVTYDRYSAESWSSQLTDAQQRISAQYALLANADAE
ncbi:hypothetical protein H0264_06290 [Nocardia huaxiensis]|uniref:Uncharacterized protein n=1 Tax=Nocardia huaxiensis TaxID=2755382 RepID=A0A7D6VAN4_9NOCA|nr:hypothetical protein [Nocardia huaxiensis]QLY31912.1 hypothetical protein H0264_06290 [Nocardia huaxiensis]